MGDDLRHGRLTARLLAVAQHLTEKRPQRDDGGIDRTAAEQVAGPGEETFDPAGREHVGEGPPRPREKRRDGLPKTGAAAAGRMSCLAHEEVSKLESRHIFQRLSRRISRLSLSCQRC
jgi:hypothetical protein